MSSSLVTVLCVTVAAIGIAAVIGVLVNRRSGVLRESAEAADTPDTAELGLSMTGPTVVHFSAVWCGPCAAVRRVVNQVCGDLPDVAHVEIDMDANPVAARRLSVLSLPTTFVFDADGRQRYRTAGVPKAADLRSKLVPLLASPHRD
jgi:thiol-disulfide isomerase/thioredoxin